MASFLDDMPAAIFAGFKGKLRGGIIRALSEGTGIDAHGRPTGAVPTDHPIEGFSDQYSAFTRAAAGIPDTDLKVCIFAASLPPGFVPQKDMIARLDPPAGPVWYKLRGADTDPATALWICPAFEIKAPDDGG